MPGQWPLQRLAEGKLTMNERPHLLMKLRELTVAHQKQGDCALCDNLFAKIMTVVNDLEDVGIEIAVRVERESW